MKNLIFLKKGVFTLALTFLCLIVKAQQFDYLPAAIDNHQILKYEHFALSYNEEHEQADWVAYELTDDEVDMDGDRCNCFKSDGNVTTKSASTSDYTNTGFDKGHLAPSADFYMSEQANAETYLMSNMSPQSPGLNREVWADLEAWVRETALEHGKLYVVTGPVFVNNLGTIGKNEVTIPGYFYKVLLRFDRNGKAKTIGFLLPNVGVSKNLKDYIVPVNLIETMTGLDFFPALPARVENRNESQFEPSSWGFRN